MNPLSRRSLAVTSTLATLMFSACDKGLVTAPEPQSALPGAGPRLAEVLPSVPASTPYPGTQQAGRAVVCKHVSSPAGTYTFNVAVTGSVAGDQHTTTATLQPGECAIVFNRTTATTAPPATVTVNEVVPAGATYQVSNVSAVGTSGAASTATHGTVTPNWFHGGVITFTNVPVGGLPQLTTYPGTETPGHAKLCKNINSPAGTYNFTISASGLVAGDQVATTASLQPGQCAIIFIRTVSNTSLATLTVTETVPVGATFQVGSITKLQFGVTTTVTGTATTTISENTFHGGVLTYNNVVSATPNFGLGSAPYPGTETPGQAKVCKHAASPAGLYTFNISAAGTIAGDQVASTISIGPGQCAIVFIRTTANTSLATLTVTEVVPAGMAVTSIVKIQFGVTTTLLGVSSATISENFFHGGVLTFTNALILAASHGFLTTG